MRRGGTHFLAEQRRAEIARLYARNYTQQEIANQLKLSVSTVNGHIKTIKKRYREMQMDALEAQKGRELLKLDNLEREAWAGYERSLKERVIMETQRGVLAGSETEDTRLKNVKLRREQRDGSVQYLQLVWKCIERRCVLMGLDEPFTVDITESVRQAARAAGLSDREVEEAVEEAEFVIRESQGGRR
ncbi:MAG: helix-turn-helix domain-containing protein [Chloroflexota bacterium]